MRLVWEHHQRDVPAHPTVGTALCVQTVCFTFCRLGSKSTHAHAKSTTTAVEPEGPPGAPPSSCPGLHVASLPGGLQPGVSASSAVLGNLAQTSLPTVWRWRVLSTCPLRSLKLSLNLLKFTF